VGRRARFGTTQAAVQINRQHPSKNPSGRRARLRRACQQAASPERVQSPSGEDRDEHNKGDQQLYGKPHQGE